MTRTQRTVIAFAACLLGAALALPAQAQHRHGGHHAHGGYYRGGVGVSIGIPIGWPYWGYGYPYYGGYPYGGYPPQVVVVPQGPTSYVEQPRIEAAPEVAGYWYYCAGAAAYYPYVKECPGGWQRVSPRPPGE